MKLFFVFLESKCASLPHIWKKSDLYYFLTSLASEWFFCIPSLNWTWMTAITFSWTKKLRTPKSKTRLGNSTGGCLACAGVRWPFHPWLKMLQWMVAMVTAYMLLSIMVSCGRRTPSLCSYPLIISKGHTQRPGTPEVEQRWTCLHARKGRNCSPSSSFTEHAARVRFSRHKDC